MRFKGPLANSYVSAVALVLCALTPFLALTTALLPLTSAFEHSTGLSAQALELTTGMSFAGYAFGTIAAVQLAAHLPPRRMLVAYAALFVIASVLAAGAWTPGLFIAGRIVQGLCTSLMLIAALPPLVIGWPASKMPWTGGIINVCIFGAVAAGPVIGAAQAGNGAWGDLFWAIAGVAGLTLALALLTFEDQPPQDRGARWDWVAQLLAGMGCVAAFFGASELLTHRFLSPITFPALVVGVVLVGALVVFEHQIENPLVPVRSLTSTLPLSGILAAIFGGAASVALVELTELVLEKRTSETHAAVLFLPELGAAIFTAILFGALFRTRFTPVLALAGLLALGAAAAVLNGIGSGPIDVLVPVGAGLTGFGMAASVSPALFIAGFSQRSSSLQRVFALIELLRAVAAFMVAPILVHLALTSVPASAAGVSIAMWVILGVAATGALVCTYLFVLGRVRLRPPELDLWLKGDGPAMDSPPLLEGIRGERWGLGEREQSLTRGPDARATAQRGL